MIANTTNTNTCLLYPDPSVEMQMVVLLKITMGRKLTDGDKRALFLMREALKRFIGEAAEALIDHIENDEMIFKDEALIEECMDKLEQTLERESRNNVFGQPISSPADGYFEIEPCVSQTTNADWYSGTTLLDATGIVTEITQYEPDTSTGTGEFIGEEPNQDVAMSPASGTIGEI